jgi:hypothetical protein
MVQIALIFSSNLPTTDKLLKRRHRARSFWQSRYFSISDDNTLRYYNKEGDQIPKTVYRLPHLPDCAVSDLFVAKQGKQLIYCLKLTWSPTLGDESVRDESQLFSDTESLFSNMEELGGYYDEPGVAPGLAPPPPQQPTFAPPPASTRSEKRQFLSRRKRHPSDVSQQQPPSNQRQARSVDDESLTYWTRRHKQEQIQLALRSDSPDNNAKIPSTVEVEERLDPTGNANNANNSAPNAKPSYEEEEKEWLRAQFVADTAASRQKQQRKVVEGTKLAAAAGATVGVAVMTAGVGLLAGLLFLGAAAGSSGAAILSRGTKAGELTIASTDYEKMRRWKACLDAALESGTLGRTKWGKIFVQGKKAALFPKAKGFGEARAATSPRVGQKTVHFEHAAQWWPLQGGWATFLTGAPGLRIFREERTALDGKPGPLKSQLVLPCSALDAFLCLMSYGRLSPGEIPVGQRSCFRTLESIDDNTDVIHLTTMPIYLFPSWTTPRDFVLYRYWRHEEDGTFVVCYESIQHKDCPPSSDYCRGELHQVFTIAPHKRSYKRKAANTSESYMTAWVQVDPKGWVPTTPCSFFSNQGYGDAFAVAALTHLLDIRDAIDQDRFVPVALDNTEYHPVQLRSFDLDARPALRANNSMESEDLAHDLAEDLHNYDFSFAGREMLQEEDVTGRSTTGLATYPPPFDKWAEPDANSFRVRGKNYKVDRQKINAGRSVGRLIAVDVVHVDAPIYTGFTTHATERFQLALAKDKALKEKGLPSDLPAFVFCVNIVLPGPPFYHGVFFYAIDDMSKIDGSDGTPNSMLCRNFFFGPSDEFRDKTFKLIPQIVQGNFIVRKAVGSTPAIMGKKLRQLYIRTERSFEIVIDCGSSPVATGVIRLSLSYAKSLVVDMGFLFEGADEARLPERIFGCARIRNAEFGPHVLRKVQQPP